MRNREMPRAVYGDSGDGRWEWADKIAWHSRVRHGRLSAIRRGGNHEVSIRNVGDTRDAEMTETNGNHQRLY